MYVWGRERLCVCERESICVEEKDSVCVCERERDGVCVEKRERKCMRGGEKEIVGGGGMGGGAKVCVHCVICLCTHTQLKLLYFCCNPGRDECCGSHKLRKETSRLQV